MAKLQAKSTTPLEWKHIADVALTDFDPVERCFTKVEAKAEGADLFRWETNRGTISIERNPQTGERVITAEAGTEGDAALLIRHLDEEIEGQADYVGWVFEGMPEEPYEWMPTYPR